MGYRCGYIRLYLLFYRCLRADAAWFRTLHSSALLSGSRKNRIF